MGQKLNTLLLTTRDHGDLRTATHKRKRELAGNKLDPMLGNNFEMLGIKVGQAKMANLALLF